MIAHLMMLLFAYVMAPGMAPPSTQASQRDLSRYDQAPPCVLSIKMNKEQWRKNLGAIRQFIWKDTQERKLAFAKVTFVSLEGYAHTFRFYVEPDSGKVWTVNIEEETEGGDPLVGKPEVTRSDYHAYYLSWVSADTKAGQPTAAPDGPSSDEDFVFFERHRLQFLDENKRVLESL